MRRLRPEYVLRRINWKIKEGEFVTINGPSGAGKSTLLSILGMLDGAWTGEFEFVNHQVHRMKPRDRAELNKKYIGFGIPELPPDRQPDGLREPGHPALLPQREKFRARRGRVRHARPLPHRGQARPVPEPAFRRQQQL